eukprot:TRINITY_DN20437_c0_g1_i1.p1 TRINITY_DN20437_c0_g1~~TRINITY_DN20437_c0_g1_i1.p1  ORF type:complete len:260 (+),score=58.12 TRINITY_DN20437_c0_g1_i1:76-855(+)
MEQVEDKPCAAELPPPPPSPAPAPPAPSLTREQLIAQEARELEGDRALPGVRVIPEEEVFISSNPNRWRAILQGPRQTPWEGMFFEVLVEFPDNYPVACPDMRFLTPIWHCNVSPKGEIAYQVLREKYVPGSGARKALAALHWLLVEPVRMYTELNPEAGRALTERTGHGNNLHDVLARQFSIKSVCLSRSPAEQWERRKHTGRLRLLLLAAARHDLLLWDEGFRNDLVGWICPDAFRQIDDGGKGGVPRGYYEPDLPP